MYLVEHIDIPWIRCSSPAYWQLASKKGDPKGPETIKGLQWNFHEGEYSFLYLHKDALIADLAQYEQKLTKTMLILKSEDRKAHYANRFQR